MLRFPLRHALPAALLLLGLTQTARAQQYFAYDATINHNIGVPVIVGYANGNDLSRHTNGRSPRVSIVGGAELFQGLSIYNGSAVTINDGYVYRELDVLDSGALTVAKGNIDFLITFFTSVANLSAANIAYSLNSYDCSAVAISGGSVTGFGVYGGSRMDVRGGSFGNDLYLSESGTLNFFGTGLRAVYAAPDAAGYNKLALSGVLSDGSSLDGKFLYKQVGSAAQVWFNPALDVYFPNDATLNHTVGDSAIVGYASASDRDNKTNPTGPAVALENYSSVGNDLLVYNNSSITMRGGYIGNALETFDSSVVNLCGGGVSGGLYANNASRVNLSGTGVAHGVVAESDSVVTITGGYIGATTSAFIGAVFAYDRSRVNISDGNIAGDLYVANSATLNLFGVGLRATLVDANAFNYQYSKYILSGVRADGNSVKGRFLYVENHSSAKFNLVSVGAPPRGIYPVVGRADTGRAGRSRTRPA